MECSEHYNNMEAEGEIHNLAEAFYIVCTEADKAKRAVA